MVKGTAAWLSPAVMYSPVVPVVPYGGTGDIMSPCHNLETIAGCQGHVLSSSAENLMSGCTCRLFIPVCTGSGSGMQNPLANIHWRFLLKSEMIGAPK